MTILYQGRKSGEIFEPATGGRAYWTLSPTTIAFTQEYTGNATMNKLIRRREIFTGKFKFGSTGLEESLITDISFTFSRPDSSGDVAWSVHFDAPIQGPPDQIISINNYPYKVNYSYRATGDEKPVPMTGHPEGPLTRHPVTNNRSTLSGYSWSSLLKDNWWVDAFSDTGRDANNVDLDKATNITNNTSIISIITNTSAPTYNVSNTYAKNLVGDVLTGAPKLAQNSFDAKFYNLGGGRYGVQQKGKNTIDEITGATSLQFQDQAISLANDVAATFNQVKGINDVSGVVFRLYNAAFARLPDANGLENWINGNKSGGQTYASSALEFSKSQEFKNRYGSNVSDTQYINTLYNNVLGRTPDPGGLSHYQGLLASGKDRGSLLLDFSESPENRQLFTKVTGLS